MFLLEIEFRGKENNENPKEEDAFRMEWRKLPKNV